MKPIQMLLSQNQKLFGEFFSAFVESTKNLEYFEKKDIPRKSFVAESLDCKKLRYLNAGRSPSRNTYGQSTC